MVKLLAGQGCEPDFYIPKRLWRDRKFMRASRVRRKPVGVPPYADHDSHGCEECRHCWGKGRFIRPAPALFIANQLSSISGRLGSVGPDFCRETWTSSLVAWREWSFAIRKRFAGLGANQNALPARLLAWFARLWWLVPKLKCLARLANDCVRKLSCLERKAFSLIRKAMVARS